MSTENKIKQKVTGKVFDSKLFLRLLLYSKSYKPQFITSIVAVILIALFAAIRPILLQVIIDDYITNKKYKS